MSQDPKTSLLGAARAPDRVPQWLLERYALGELSVERQAEVGRLLLAEEGGAERLAALRAADARFLVERPPFTVVPALRAALPAPATRSSLGRGWLLVPALAASLGALLVLRSPAPTAEVSPPTPAGEEGIGVKGLEAGLEVHRRSRAGVESLPEGAAARPGDMIQLSTRAGQGSYGLILSIDGRGGLTRHLPVGGPAAAPLDAGLHALPTAFELDDAPAFERFFFISSDRPFEVEPVIAAARALAARPDAASAPLLLPAGLQASATQSSSFLLRKVSP